MLGVNRCFFYSLSFRGFVDIISHALIGAIVAQLCLWKMDDSSKRKRLVVAGALLAAAPDIANIPLYLHLGALNERFLWIPYHSDWDGHRAAYPMMVVGWEITHSLILAALIGYFLYRKKYALWPVLCWASHLLVDVLTHTGEWASVPLWPVYLKVEGFNDPWKWSPSAWLFSNIAFFVIFYLISKYMERWRINYPGYLLPAEAWSRGWESSHDAQG
ncbi:metal-dependent hydrolase [Deltaproteobacteria bacterium]|nr:metal-dependent hydrolase [Deltaproteobacteria bacterium]